MGGSGSSRKAAPKLPMDLPGDVEKKPSVRKKKKAR
jgi:hypothetical protein